MAQQGKVLAPSPNDLICIPGIHMVEGEIRPLNQSSEFHRCSAACACT